MKTPMFIYRLTCDGCTSRGMAEPMLSFQGSGYLALYIPLTQSFQVKIVYTYKEYSFWHYHFGMFACFPTRTLYRHEFGFLIIDGPHAGLFPFWSYHSQETFKHSLSSKTWLPFIEITERLGRFYFPHLH